MLVSFENATDGEVPLILETDDNQGVSYENCRAGLTSPIVLSLHLPHEVVRYRATHDISYKHLGLVWRIFGRQRPEKKVL